MSESAPVESARFLESQVAVVTGAGRGIGKATSIALSRAGASVVLAARSLSELEGTAAEIAESGAECVAIPTDVTDESACRRLIDAAAERYGQIDILVNNAGAARFKPVWELSLADLDFNLDTNLRGLFSCCQAAMPHMMSQKSGTIVNVSSTSGKKPYPHQGAYCAAKAAVISLSRVMALELRPYGIKVHVLCPGGVDTRMAAEIHPGRSKEGWIQPEDIAQAILYLLATPANITLDELAIRRFEAEPL